jgi:hypothetical protein
VTFTDAAGRVWRIGDDSILAGKVIRHQVGGSAAYRLFVPVDRGARRSCLFHLNDDHAPTQELLEQQLAAGKLYWKDDLERYAIARAAGLKANPPECSDVA